MKTVEFIEKELPYDIKEEMKQLRTNIMFCGDDKRVIMLTSSISGEGKSSLTIDLANSFHELGKRVLLIDSDMRKSMMKRYIKDRNMIDKGLSHLLSGQCNPDDAMYKTDSGVYIIPAGYVPPNPSELLSHQRMSNLIRSLRRLFDYIIVDCPPLGAVVDAAVIANYCDGALVVVEAGKIPYKVVQGVVNQLSQADCAILGIVLNKVDVKKGRYYKNYYYKKYGYYSKEQEPAGDAGDVDLSGIELTDI